MRPRPRDAENVQLPPTWTATASRTLYSFYTEGLSLIVEVNDARYTLWLNNFTNNYYLSVTDLDVTDGYREIVVANEARTSTIPSTRPGRSCATTAVFSTRSRWTTACIWTTA